MFCNKCGAKLPENAQFCHVCGAKAFTEEKEPPKIQPEPFRKADPIGYTQPPAQARPGVPVQPAQGNPIGAPPQNIPTRQGTPPAYNGPYTGQFGAQPPYPAKKRPKWMLPLIAGATVMAALIVVIGIWAGRKKLEPVAVSGPLATEAGDGEFRRYENDEVKFALDYPAEFSLSEPNVNNVLLGKDDRCRVAVEYAYITTKNCFIYSAEDFSAQIEADPSVLSGWIGADEVTMLNERPLEQDYNGQRGHVFNWEMTQDGEDYTGGLCIFDSQGEFGAYTFLWMVEKGAEDEELCTRQAAQMLESFEITGPFQAEGYTIYECESPDYLRFALQDELIQDGMELGYDVLDNYVLISPAKSGWSQISMYTPSYQYASADPKKDDFSSAMDLAVSMYFDDPDYQDARFISQPTRLEIGRYPYIELDIQYRTGYKWEEEVTRYILHFPRGGKYWEIEMSATEENLEQTAQALVDFLMSLRVGDDGLEPDGDAFGSLSDFRLEDYQSAGSQVDMNQVIDEILTKVESTSGFVKGDDYYQPLASFTDVDGNGVSELLVLYKVKQRTSGGFDDYNVLYDVYAVKSDGSYTSVNTGVELYKEVGGNSGTLGLVVDKAMEPYLLIETSSPQGDRFNNTITYIPWDGDQSKLEDEWVYLESHGTYGEEDKGQYILGDTKVDKAAFEARQTEFMSLWTDLNLNMGPGNGGNNMSFTQIRSLDMNTYKFDSVG